MKKGYKKLLVFEILIMIILFLNSFVHSVLSPNLKIIFLVLMLFIFKLLFGFEKDKHRYSKSVCLEIITYLLIYFLIYYLFGLIIGFAKPTNYYTFQGLVKVIIPFIITVILQEILRYMMLTKSEESKLLIVTTCILFVLLDLVGIYNRDTFTGAYSIFAFIAINLLPSISKNVFCTYVSIKSGYKPTILYLLIVGSYSFFVPIIPNPNVYLYSIIELIVPMIYFYNLYKFFKKDRDEDVVRKRQKDKTLALVFPSAIVIFIVYITSGYFHYHAIAVASGSMSPTILKGDVVIVEKINEKFENLKVGQVVAYKKDKIIVIHRLYNVVKVNGEYFFYTKGDGNDLADDYKITEDMIIGTVNVRIPYIGYPTVWLNDL